MAIPDMFIKLLKVKGQPGGFGFRGWLHPAWEVANMEDLAGSVKE